jgi:hypothetical protein
MMLSEGDRNFLLEHAAVRRYRSPCNIRHTDIELKGFEGTYIL